MVETYTVQNVMPTGKSSPTYGKQYYVKFVESEQTFPLWFKTEPKEGAKIDGEINGSKFTKAKKQEISPATSAPRGRYDSDGQRQGMCINNAANYVNSMATELATPEKWAKTVWLYANELYKLGDLGKSVENEAPQSMEELVDDRR